MAGFDFRISNKDYYQMPFGNEKAIASYRARRMSQPNYDELMAKTLGGVEPRTISALVIVLIALFLLKFKK